MFLMYLNEQDCKVLGSGEFSYWCTEFDDCDKKIMKIGSSWIMPNYE